MTRADALRHSEAEFRRYARELRARADRDLADAVRAEAEAELRRVDAFKADRDDRDDRDARDARDD